MNRGIYLSWKDIDKHIYPMTRLYFDNLKKTGFQVRIRVKVGEIRNLGNF